MPQSKERKQQITEAALAVFSQKGFYQARMEDIAAVAGLGKGTLYLYFKDKDALIIAIAETVFQEDVAELEVIVEQPGAAVEKLQLLLQRFIAEMKQNYAVMPVVYEFYAMSVRRDDVRQLLKRYHDASVALLEKIIQAGVVAGDLPPETDVTNVALTFIALLEGVFLQSFYAKDTAQRLNYSIGLLLKGLNSD